MRFSPLGVACRRLRLRWAAVLSLLFACFLLANAVAYIHAYRMTHYVTAGTRTPRPESLSLREKVRVLVTGPVLPKSRTMKTPRELGLDYRAMIVTASDNTRLATWWVPSPPGV